LKKLIESIDKEKFHPRFRIYVRNEKYPNGKVINIRYRSLDAILDMNKETGITCPNELDLGIELQKLSFLKLAQTTEEVDIERAVLDTYEFIHSKVGKSASIEQVMRLLFEKENTSA
jgi:hypothetical protein